MTTPLMTYQQKINYLKNKIQAQSKKSHLLGNLRLLVSLGGLSLSIFLFIKGQNLWALSILSITILIFVCLVNLHRDLKKLITFDQALLKVNQKGTNRLTEEWTTFSDTGEEYLTEDHPYSVDLDIFGRRSLFQLLNTTTTFLGREMLKGQLLNPSPCVKNILLKQGMIKELAPRLTFRQNMQAAGRCFLKSRNNPQELFSWVASKGNKFSLSFLFRILIWSSPLTLIATTLGLLLIPGIIPPFIPLAIFLGHGLLLFSIQKKASHYFAVTHKYAEEIQGYQHMLKYLSEETFENPTLNSLQKKLMNKDQEPAFQQIYKLKKAVTYTYIRHHQLYFIFNLFTLWDFHCLNILERWKETSGSNLKEWLYTLGEIELLSSLATLHYEQPDWCFPEFTDQEWAIKAQKLGHPLLSATRVTNDLLINQPGEVLLITGSNMSGKSTFLRTVGINLILAYLGAPVCAKFLQCPFLKIYTSMRVSDNLDTGTSSFLAELLRIKTVLIAAQEGKPILFLLDEIFKGTNSRDRHTGAKHLIQKLISTGALGLVSTHDLELGDLSKENPRIINYHFREYYQNGQIYFDYQLRPGVSTTRNALYLMKMVGIDLNF